MLSRAADQALSVSKEKQRIKGFPANSKVRKKAAQIVALKIAGRDNDEIAKLVHLSPRTLKQYMYIAGQNGWLTTADPDDDLEFRLKHKIVRNVEGVLDGTLVPNPSQQEMTIAAAKGTGLFKQHDANAKGAMTLPPMAIQVNVIGGPAMLGQRTNSHQLDQFPEGSVGGCPAYVEGQAIGETNGDPTATTTTAASDSARLTASEDRFPESAVDLVAERQAVAALTED